MAPRLRAFKCGEFLRADDEENCVTWRAGSCSEGLVNQRVLIDSVAYTDSCGSTR